MSPGESSSDTGPCPDSVFVWDGAQQRVTVIDATGAFVRQYRLPAEANSVLATVECSSTGTFVLLGFPPDIRPPSEDGDSPHYQAPLWLADAVGRITHELGEVPVVESRPLGKITSIAVGPRRLVVGTNDSAFVDVYTLGGEYSRTIPIGVSLRAPTRRHYERAIDRQVAMLARPVEREEFRSRFLRIPMPEHLPPYGALVVDPTGILWVSVQRQQIVDRGKLGRDERACPYDRAPRPSEARHRPVGWSPAHRAPSSKRRGERSMDGGGAGGAEAAEEMSAGHSAINQLTTRSHCDAFSARRISMGCRNREA